MYAQCDVDGNEYLLLYSIFDHFKDEKVITITDQQTSIWHRPLSCKSTADWKICCQWEDSANLKESCPVQTVEFAVAHGIDCKPAFNWWFKHMLKKD